MTDAVSTPDGREFSIAAKLYICSGRVLPPGGGMFFWTSPTGVTISSKTLAEGLVITTLDWLNENGWNPDLADRGQAAVRQGPGARCPSHPLGSPRVRGQAARVHRMAGLRPHADDFRPHRAPLPGPENGHPCRGRSRFRGGGDLSRASGNKEWLDYLSTAWHEEAAQWYAHAMAQPWAETARRNTVAGIGARLESRDDD